MVKRGIFLFLLFARIVLPLHGDDDAQIWSPAQSGLEARLFVSPAHSADYTYGISIELQNVLVNSSDSGLDMNLNLNSDDLVITVRDATGQRIKPSPPAMLNGIVPGWSLRLPAWARISFPVGRGGGAPRQEQGLGKLLSFGGVQQWVLPSTGGPFRISATLYSNTEQAMRAQGEVQGIPVPAPLNVDRVRQAERGTRGGWQGTLDLPSINLPQN